MGAVYWVTDTQEVETEAVGEAPAGEADTAPRRTPETHRRAETPPWSRGRRSSPRRKRDAAAATRSPTPARTGSVGPNLDEAKPSGELVVDRVTNGKGVMPSFKGKLTEQQIDDVAAYVSTVAGSS